MLESGQLGELRIGEVPDASRAVIRSGGQLFPIGAEPHRSHRTLVPEQRGDSRARFLISNHDRRATVQQTARRKQFAVARRHEVCDLLCEWLQRSGRFRPIPDSQRAVRTGRRQQRRVRRGNRRNGNPRDFAGMCLKLKRRGSIGRGPGFDETRSASRDDDRIVAVESQRRRGTGLIGEHRWLVFGSGSKDANLTVCSSGDREFSISRNPNSLHGFSVPGQQRWRSHRKFPQLNRAVVATGEELRQSRMPGEGSDGAIVSSGNDSGCGFHDIPESNKSEGVTRRGLQTVRSKRDRMNRLSVPGQSRRRRSTRRSPEPDRIVRAGCRDQFSVGRRRGGLNGHRVPGKLQCRLRQRPDSNRSILSGRGNSFSTLAKIESVDWAVVTGDGKLIRSVRRLAEQDRSRRVGSRNGCTVRREIESRHDTALRHDLPHLSPRGKVVKPNGLVGRRRRNELSVRCEHNGIHEFGMAGQRARRCQWESPQPCGSIGSAGHKPLAGRMPGDSGHGCGVSAEDSRRRGVGSVPEADDSCGVTRRELGRVCSKRRRTDGTQVARACRNRRSARPVPQSNRVVPPTRHEELLIWGESQRLDGSRVAGHQLRCRRQFPESNRAVFSGRRQTQIVRMKRHAANRAVVPEQLQPVGAVGEVPQLDGSGLTAARHERRVRADRQAADGTRLIGQLPHDTVGRVEYPYDSVRSAGNERGTVAGNGDDLTGHARGRHCLIIGGRNVGCCGRICGLGESPMRRHVELPLLNGAVAASCQHGLIIRSERDPADRTGVGEQNSTDRWVFVEVLAGGPQRHDAGAVAAGPLIAVDSKSSLKNLGRVTFQRLQQLAGLAVPDSHDFVVADGNREQPVGSNSEVVNRRGVAGPARCRRIGGDVPEADRVVVGTGSKRVSVRADGQAQDEVLMTGQCAKRLAGAAVPELQRAVVTGRRKNAAVWGEDRRTDFRWVSVDDLGKCHRFRLDRFLGEQRDARQQTAQQGPKERGTAKTDAASCCRKWSL